MPFFDTVTPKKEIPWEWVRAQVTEQDAYWLCINHATVKRTQQSIADLIDIDRSVLSRALNSGRGDKNYTLSRVYQIRLQEICNNTAIDQWAQEYERNMLHCQRTAEQQLAELEEQKQKVLERMEQVG